MKCSTPMCGGHTTWSCSQCDLTWLERVFGFYKTSSRKNMFCFNCCGSNWHPYILGRREQAILHGRVCPKCIGAGGKFIQSLQNSTYTPSEPSNTSSVAPPASVSPLSAPPPPPPPPPPPQTHRALSPANYASPSVYPSALTPPTPPPLAPVAMVHTLAVVAKSYDGREKDSTGMVNEFGYLQVEKGDKVTLLCPPMPGHRGNLYRQYTYAWNGSAQGWIPNAVLETTAVGTMDLVQE